jgi:hypothetical protein
MSDQKDIIENNIKNYIDNCTLSYTDPQQCASNINPYGGYTYYGDNTTIYPTTIGNGTIGYPAYYPYYSTTTTGDHYWIYTQGNQFDSLSNREWEDVEKLPGEIKMKITKDVEKAIKDKIKIEFDSQLKSMRDTMNDLNLSIVNEATAINILKQEKVLLEKQINEFKEQLGKILKDIEEASEKYAKRVMRFQLLDIEKDE